MEANIWLHWANLSPECTAVQLQKYSNNEDEMRISSFNKTYKKFLTS